MRSIATRVAAALAAGAAAVLLAACGGSADSSGDGGAGSGIPETPVITGEPAGHNADDIAFATAMIPHHQQAIELSKLVPDRTTDSELAALASRIPTEQQSEINILNVFLVQWNENSDAGTFSGDEHAAHGQAMPGMVDEPTMTKLKSLSGAEFDRLWLQSMISHHQGAVEMAKAEVANGNNVDAVAMARTMVAMQEAEIGQMKKMLEAKP
jgi:uncharacterized protein (DUF305 family)